MGGTWDDAPVFLVPWDSLGCLYLGSESSVLSGQYWSMQRGLLFLSQVFEDEIIMQTL
jgi:hypothetical protein